MNRIGKKLSIAYIRRLVQILLLHGDSSLAGDFTPRETVDVYLANLHKLSVPCGGINDKILSYAFLVGLPEDISKFL